MGWSSIPKIPKIASLECLYSISKKNLEMKLILCIQINIFLNFLQVDFQAWGIKVCCEVILSLLIGMIKYSQSTQSIKIEISLQYPKKRLDGFHFLYAHKHQSFFKSALSLLMKLVRHTQN